MEGNVGNGGIGKIRQNVNNPENKGRCNKTNGNQESWGRLGNWKVGSVK